MRATERSEETLFTVKQVATLTGLTEATLRAWERRYGVVTPSRSPNGYRVYSDAQVAVLREMAALVRSGVPASRASAVVTTSPSLTAVEAGPVPDPDALVAAAQALDPIALRAAIDQAFASGPFEEVAESWLPDELRRIGDAWESGRLSVAQEHFASTGLMHAIAGVFSSAPEPNPAWTTLVGLPPGARHDLMLFSFAACLKRLGCAVIYLGVDVPVESWLAAAHDGRPRVAVLGVTAASEVSAAQEIIDRLRAVVPPIAVWVGGSQRDGCTGAKPLPDGVSQAAALLHRSFLAGRH